MKKLKFVAIIFLISACGSSAENPKIQKEDVEPVLIQSVDEERCDRIVVGEVKALRAGQALMCHNQGSKTVALELASEPSANSQMQRVYSLPARSSRKFNLPFIKGFINSDIYMRIDHGEWRELCNQRPDK